MLTLTLSFISLLSLTLTFMHPLTLLHSHPYLCVLIAHLHPYMCTLIYSTHFTLPLLSPLPQNISERMQNGVSLHYTYYILSPSHFKGKIKIHFTTGTLSTHSLFQMQNRMCSTMMYSTPFTPLFHPLSLSVRLGYITNTPLYAYSFPISHSSS
jgi:hypothetical protein